MVFVMAGVPAGVQQQPQKKEKKEKKQQKEQKARSTAKREKLNENQNQNKNGNQNENEKDTVQFPGDSTRVVEPDTLRMDSLQRAIWRHNKAVDDSLRADSLNRQRKNGIDAPVEYTAKDSMTYEASQS